MDPMESTSPLDQARSLAEAIERIADELRPEVIRAARQTQEGRRDLDRMEYALGTIGKALVLTDYSIDHEKDMDKLKELLAALLITRQVMGNIKESIIPYFKKEMKLAKLSFDLYGALSPTTEDKKLEDQEEKENLSSSSPKIKKDRILSQVELESSAPDVSFFLLRSSNYNLFYFI